MILGSAIEGRDNNLNLLRFMAATGVLLSHAYPITGGPNAGQPLETTFGITLGHLCVLVFFAISGLLITQSRQRSSSLTRWVAARVLRIFPALLVVLVLTVVLLGPTATRLPLASYALDANSWTYLPRNLSLYALQYELPGVFATLPYPDVINGSLWTLNHEVTCYFGVAVLAAVGGLARPRAGAALLVVAIAGSTVALGLAEEIGLHRRLYWLLYLAMPFMIATLFYLWRDHIGLTPIIATALVLAAWATHGSFVQHLTFSTALTYVVLWIAYVPQGPVRRFNQVGDYSYGIYIYAFPVQQTVVWLLPGQDALGNIAVALPLTLACAIASWHIVEKPALAMKGRFGRRDDRRLKPAE